MKVSARARDATWVVNDLYDVSLEYAMEETALAASKWFIREDKKKTGVQ